MRVRLPHGHDTGMLRDRATTATAGVLGVCKITDSCGCCFSWGRLGKDLLLVMQIMGWEVPCVRIDAPCCKRGRKYESERSLLDLHRLALLLGSRRPLTSSLSSAGAL